MVLNDIRKYVFLYCIIKEIFNVGLWGIYGIILINNRKFEN